MTEAHNKWFEEAEIDGKRFEHLSKFMCDDFTVPVELVREQWPLWTPDEQLGFASAFSVRAKLSDNDRAVLDFLLENGTPRIWGAITLLVVNHLDRKRALDFLLKRVSDRDEPLCNYYQALTALAAPECAPLLAEALERHRRDIDFHPSLQNWTDQFFYLDYLSCSAALFKITGQEEYRTNLKKMLEHSDETIREMVRMVSDTRGISI